jgi:hypothetical protein
MIEETWSHDEPIKYILDYLQVLFKKNDWAARSSLLQILSEFHLYNLIYAKSELKLDNHEVTDFKKATIFMNILWGTFKNNNPIMNADGRKDINSDFEFVSK